MERVLWTIVMALYFTTCAYVLTHPGTGCPTMHGICLREG